MRTHTLKIQTRWLDRVLDGTKRAEIRVHDRDYQAGDAIEFVEVNAFGNELQHARRANALITHVLDGRQAQGIDDAYCLLSIDDAHTIPEPERQP